MRGILVVLGAVATAAAVVVAIWAFSDTTSDEAASSNTMTPATSTPRTDAAPANAAATWHVASGGSGDCTASSPCGSVASAVARAGPGDLVHVQAGTYPPQVIPNRTDAAGWPTNVIVEPAPGAAVTLHHIDSSHPHLTFRNFKVTGKIHLHPTADHTRIDNIHLDGAMGFNEGADHTTWTNNHIDTPPTGNDGIQIKEDGGDPSEYVVFDHNTVGPAYLNGQSHTDCIQLFGAHHITITNNTLLECSNAGIQMGYGPTQGVSDVTIARNFITQCHPRRVGSCEGYYAIIMGYNIADGISIIHNSIHGSVLVSGGTANPTVVGNIATTVPCGTRTDWNLVEQDPCGPNDRIGTAPWANTSPTVNDLHLTSTNTPAYNAGSPHATGLAATDIDGQPPCGPPDLGADELCDTTPTPG